MRKGCGLAYISLGIVFVLVSGIAFLIPTTKTTSFWIVYAFLVIAFALQLLIWKIAWGREKTLNSRFLGIPIIYVGFVYLVVQSIVLLVFATATRFVPEWVSILLCIVILGVSLICLISADMGKLEVSRVEEKVLKKTSVLKKAQIDVKVLADSEGDSEIKQALLKLSEKIRYSDPMSGDELKPIEDEIIQRIQSIATSENKLKAIEKVEKLVAERDLRCKANKG